MGYIASAVNVVSSNPCVGPSPRIKISFLLLSIFTDQLILVSKIKTFLPILQPVNENTKQESNPMLLYLYLSGSAFLVSFTDPNKQLFNVKSRFKFLKHVLSA